MTPTQQRIKTHKRRKAKARALHIRQYCSYLGRKFMRNRKFI